MKTATHTPGPWAFSDSDITPGKFSIYHNGPLAYVGNTGDGIENARANARLIAAAPEMLEALRAGVDNDIPMADWLSMARAAIARATGAA